MNGSVYLDATRDTATNSINLLIRDVIQYLYNTYRDTPPEKATELQQKIQAMNFDPALLIDIVFNAIEPYTNIAEAYGSPIT